MLNASPQKRLRGSQAADFVGQYVHQLGLSIWTAVGQGALEMIPHAFIRVQFWGVRRKGLQVQTGRAGEKLLHRIAAMNLAIVQQNDQMARGPDATDGGGMLPLLRPEYCPRRVGSTVYNGSVFGLTAIPEMAEIRS